MNDLHSLIFTVSGWLPGLWDYPRHANVVTVLLAMLIFALALRLIGKLMPLLLVVLAIGWFLFSHLDQQKLSLFRGALESRRVEMGR